MLFHPSCADSADIGSKEVANISDGSMNGMGDSTRTPTGSRLTNHGKQESLLHGKIIRHASLSVSYKQSR